MRAVALAFVGACAPSGLTLEAVVPPGAETVELFVGDKYCYDIDCPTSIIVPDNIGRRSVDYAYLMTDPEAWTRDKAEFVDGVAGFTIKAPSKWTIGMLALVAYDASREPIASATFHDVVIGAATDERWQVELTTATLVSATVTAQPAGTESIKVWHGPSDARGSCLLVEYWGTEPEPKRALLVPAGDTDCDEVPVDAECAPWSPNANGAPPTIEDARCVTEKPINNANVCVVGGPQCYENGGTGIACMALDVDYCTPTALCGCTGTGLDCVRAKLDDFSSFAAMPHLSCEIELDPEGRPCDGERFAIDGSVLLSPNGTPTTTCKEMRLANLAFPLPSLDRSIALAPMDGAYLVLENFSSTSCTADLAWGGNAMPGRHHGVVDVALANGRHLAIPVRIDLRTGCAGASACSFSRGNSTTEAMFSCLGQVTTPVTLCEPDSSHNCQDGVWCDGPGGGECCQRGERCGPNGCTCGTTGTRCDPRIGDTCAHVSGLQYACGTACCGPLPDGTPCPF